MWQVSGQYVFLRIGNLHHSVLFVNYLMEFCNKKSERWYEVSCTDWKKDLSNLRGWWLFQGLIPPHPPQKVKRCYFWRSNFHYNTYLFKKHFAKTPKSDPDWKINIAGNPLGWVWRKSIFEVFFSSCLKWLLTCSDIHVHVKRTCAEQQIDYWINFPTTVNLVWKPARVSRKQPCEEYWDEKV